MAWKSFFNRGNSLVELYWGSIYICWLFLTLKVSSFFYWHIVQLFLEACTCCLIKLSVAVSNVLSVAKHRVSSNFGPNCIVHVFDFLLFPFCAPKIHCACGQCHHLPHPRYSSVTMYSEVETDWKKEIVAGRKYYPCLRPEKARKITRIIIQDGQQPDRYSAVTEVSELGLSRHPQYLHLFSEGRREVQNKDTASPHRLTCLTP